ncbi:MAG: transglutaminase family protein [Proteobacteria bacterium]|nr:transglutaminase family protein [Pseudomonadota bacterium]MBU1060729.1 transglutaminase family protein [Pseudomonadota bacterium]
MHLQTSCDLTFIITVPTPFVFMLRPRSGVQQWVSCEKYVLHPPTYVNEFTDHYGNLCQRLLAQPGDLSIMTRAEVIVADGVDRAPGGPFIEIPNLPDYVLSFLLPSRYCESEHFGQMAADITAGYSCGYDQVAAIESWIRSTIRYECGMSDIPVSASEVNSRQWGVCRDLAHLGITLCRALCIPARMVVGYLHELQPMDMHAWFEAYVADRWYTFDPTQTGSAGGYVVLGYGRDAADVAVYNQFGPAVFPATKEVSVERKD